MVAKRLELLKQVAPATTFVAVLFNPTHPAASVEVRAAERVARALGMQVQTFGARDPAQLVSVLADMTRMRAQALLPMSDRLFTTEEKTIAEFSVSHRVPVIHFEAEFAEAGGLMAYGTNIPALYRRAGTLVNKILKGARPADMPVEQPTEFDLAINVKAAKALGLTIPQTLLLRANRLIE